MDFIVTLIAADQLSDETVSAVADQLDRAAIQVHHWRWLDKGKAGDFSINAHPHEGPRIRAALGDIPEIDIAVQPEATRKKMLLVADMDSTMIPVECIDELADYAGIKPQIAEITERAMQGELDFAEALAARVALLEGLPETTVEQCLRERVTLMPGARTLIQTMRGWGAECVLVSGGFMHFVGPVSEQIGFGHGYANRLEILDGKLTGRVEQPIVDSAFKRRILEEWLARMDLPRQRSLAVGDGANDIPMIEAAGTGYAYHAKEKARAAADVAIRYGDLTTLLYAQGIARADWVEA